MQRTKQLNHRRHSDTSFAVFLVWIDQRGRLVWPGGVDGPHCRRARTAPHTHSSGWTTNIEPSLDSLGYVYSDVAGIVTNGMVDLLLLGLHGGRGSMGRDLVERQPCLGFADPNCPQTPTCRAVVSPLEMDRGTLALFVAINNNNIIIIIIQKR